MFLPRLFLIFSMTFSLLSTAKGQCEHKILSGEKLQYNVDEEVKIQIILHPDPKACKDGMEKTAIYASGMEILSRSCWTEICKGSWQVILVCKVKGNKKGIGQLTVVRKNDRDNLFDQIKFQVN